MSLKEDLESVEFTPQEMELFEEFMKLSERNKFKLILKAISDIND